MDSTKQHKKHWKDFSYEEKQVKLEKIAEALKEKNLHTEVKVKESEKVVFGLKEQGECEPSSGLSISGKFSASKAKNVKNLSKALNE